MLPKYSKRHYEQFAQMLHEAGRLMQHSVALPAETHAAVMELFAAKVGMVFAQDNPAFDSWRFYAASGIARFREVCEPAKKITATVKISRKNSINRGATP